jgi:hypothetical protein
MMATKKAKKETIKIEQVEAVRKTELARFRRDTPELVRQAGAMVVKSADDETLAYEVVSRIKAMIKAADERRKAITSPLEQAKKETIRLFKDLVAPLEKARDKLSDKITNYRDKQERIAAEAERKRQEELAELERKQAEAQAKAHGRKTVKGRANAQAVADELDDAMTELEQTEYVPDVGDASVVKTWTYEIEDEDQVPRKFCSPDLGKLRAAVRAGTREIKGVKIFQQSSVRGRY